MQRASSRVLVATDIFGKTNALVQLANQIGANVCIIDPYQGQNLEFQSESEAYNHFIAQVGLDSYSAHLQQVITAEQDPLSLIGFSVGASAIWQVAAKNCENKVEKALGFYGSQIRHSSHLTPIFPIKMIFPVFEPHFCVDDLMQTLVDRQNVSVEQSEYLHGFMNQHSLNFSSAGYNQYLIKITQWLEEGRKTQL